jgi:hypothetical protein
MAQPFFVPKGNIEQGKRGARELIGRRLFEGAEGGEPTEEQSSSAIGDARRRHGSARGRGRPRRWAELEWVVQANKPAGP